MGIMKNFRDALTGRFTTAKDAAARPAQTVAERRHPVPGVYSDPLPYRGKGYLSDAEVDAFDRASYSREEAQDVNAVLVGILEDAGVTTGDGSTADMVAFYLRNRLSIHGYIIVKGRDA